MTKKLASSQTSQFPRGMAAWTSSTGTGCIFLCIVRQPPGSGLFPLLGYFGKRKASLSQPAEARSCPLCFRSSKTSHTSGLARRKIFPIPFPVYHISQVCLVDFCRDTSIFLIPCCGGNVPCLCTIQPPTRRQLGCSRRRLFLGSVDEKDTATSAGTKTSE